MFRQALQQTGTQTDWPVGWPASLKVFAACSMHTGIGILGCHLYNVSQR